MGRSRPAATRRAASRPGTLGVASLRSRREVVGRLGACQAGLEQAERAHTAARAYWSNDSTDAWGGSGAGAWRRHACSSVPWFRWRADVGDDDATSAGS